MREVPPLPPPQPQVHFTTMKIYKIQHNLLSCYTIASITKNISYHSTTISLFLVFMKYTKLTQVTINCTKV